MITVGIGNAGQELVGKGAKIPLAVVGIGDEVGISSRVELVLYAMSHGENRPAEWMPSSARALPA